MAGGTQYRTPLLKVKLTFKSVRGQSPHRPYGEPLSYLPGPVWFSVLHTTHPFSKRSTDSLLDELVGVQKYTEREKRSGSEL